MPFFHSVLQRQAQNPMYIQLQSFSPQHIPNLGVLSGLWYLPLTALAPLVACLLVVFFLHSTSLLRVVFAALSSPHPPTMLNHAHPSTSILPPFHHLRELASDSAPSSPRGPRPAWFQNSSQYLAWTESWQGRDVRCPSTGWWPPRSLLR